MSDICIQKRGNEPVQYLVLVPQNDPGVRVMVPVESAEKVGLRNIISSEAADELLESFSTDQNVLLYEPNFVKRRQAYQEVMKNGTLPALVSLIQELMRQPKLNSGDKELLPRAQRKLFSEIALAKGMEFQRVLDLASSRMLPAGGMI